MSPEPVQSPVVDVVHAQGGGRHLHGDHAAHFSFPKAVWTELWDQGRIGEHPVFPGRVGPAARRIASEADVRDVIQLMRLNYERAVAAHGIPDAA